MYEMFLKTFTVCEEMFFISAVIILNKIKFLITLLESWKKFIEKLIKKMNFKKTFLIGRSVRLFKQ